MDSIFMLKKTMFLTLCAILFVGTFVEALPVQKARYKGVRCRPDGNSANCVEEGAIFEIAQEKNKIIFPPMMRRPRSISDMIPLSVEESGSGTGGSSGAEPDVSSGAEPDVSSGAEPGSGKVYATDYSDTSETDDLIQKFSENLSGEDLIL
ncbi:hypothetical protein FKM82_029037 [Ascaphus truei]|uniref:serglycin n=1 Tax=Ascaphus truei TaxID=8439 RepID=UPI003F5A4E8C